MLGAKGFLTFWPRYLTYSKKRTLLHLWNAASVFLLFSYILFSNHNFTSFLPHPLFWHTHTARFRWSVPSLPLLSFELSQLHKAGRTWTCILCLILYEKFAVRSTNMKHFSAQVLPVKLPPYSVILVFLSSVPSSGFPFGILIHNSSMVSCIFSRSFSVIAFSPVIFFFPIRISGSLTVKFPVADIPCLRNFSKCFWFSPQCFRPSNPLICRALCPTEIFASAFADGRFFTASAHQPTPHPEFSDREVCLPPRQAVRRFLPVRR